MNLNDIFCFIEPNNINAIATDISDIKIKNLIVLI